MYVVYGFCTASIGGGGFLWEGIFFLFKKKRKRGQVSVSYVDSINVLKNGLKLRIF